MASKKRGGLSKREYAAKMAGGNLNYKTGKISTPSKSSSSKSSSKISSKSSDFSKYTSMDWGSAAAAAKRAGIDTRTGSAFDLAMNKKYNPTNYNNLTGIEDEGDFEKWTPSEGRAVDSKYSQSEKDYVKNNQSKLVNKSQRESAAKVSNSIGNAVRSGLGIGTAKAATSYIKPAKTKGIVERGLEILKDPLGIEPRARAIFNDMPWGSKIYQKEGGAQDAINQLLTGVTPEIGFSEKYMRDDTPMYQDSPIVETNNREEETTNVPAPYKSWDTYNASQNNRTSSRPVSKPINQLFQQPQSSAISSILGISPQSAPARSPQSAPDYSAGQITNPTRRQFLGNGLLSKGTYGNGAGNYGIEGAINSDMDNTNFLDDLLTLVGIKPQVANAATQPSIMNIAQASENPQSSYELHQTTNPLPGITPDDQIEYINGVPFWKDDNSQTKYDAYENQVKNLESQLPPEEVAWANSPDNGQISNQSNTMAFNNIGYNSNPAVQQYQDSIKGFKTQEKDTKKAYEKALSEMLKGIEAQYAQSQAAGESELNKQKVNDLQALASRFSFGLNQDPNSEQAIQYQQRTANDYAGQLTDFLAKLAAAKTQDIASARSGNQSNLMSALNSISNKRNSAQEKLANLLYQMQQDAQSNALKNKPNLYQMATSLKNQGNSWGNIAYQLGNAGFDLTPGNENSKSLDAIMTGQPPTVATAPKRSTNPMPTDDGYGNVIDGNPYSPTYGMEMEQV